MLKSEELISKIKTYNKFLNPATLTKAYDFALKAHNTQKREEGVPYINHPVAVASILTELKLDSATIATGLLHDTIEDTHATYNTILNEKLVHGAMPFVYDKRVIVPFQGKRYLNLSTRKVCEPSADPQVWDANFPFMGGLLHGILGDDQLPYWLAWASRFYKACYKGEPNQGHAVFLIGDTGLGKTMINENVLDVLFNGTASCGRFLMGEDNGFNSHLFDYGLWTCDDRVPASDRKKHQHYTSTVKSIVANGVFNIEEKYMKTGQLVWNGRLSVTANHTTEDIRMIPELNVSMRDKILLFKAKRAFLSDI